MQYFKKINLFLMSLIATSSILDSAVVRFGKIRAYKRGQKQFHK